MRDEHDLALVQACASLHQRLKLPLGQSLEHIAFFAAAYARGVQSASGALQTASLSGLSALLRANWDTVPVAAREYAYHRDRVQRVFFLEGASRALGAGSWDEPAAAAAAAAAKLSEGDGLARYRYVLRVFVSMWCIALVPTFLLLNIFAFHIHSLPSLRCTCQTGRCATSGAVCRRNRSLCGTAGQRSRCRGRKCCADV